MQDILYKITFGFFWLLSLMPLKVHYFFSDFLLYPLIYHLIGYRKKVVRENLKGSSNASSTISSATTSWRTSRHSPCLRKR